MVEFTQTTDKERVGRVFAKAFNTIKFDHYISNDKTREEHTTELINRVQDFVDIGADVVQAGDFTAVAMWVGPHLEYPAPTGEPSERGKELKEKMKVAVEKHLKDKPHWNLGFLGKDPDKSVKGAVSAVVKPFLEKAKSDGVPAMLLGVDDHARDVYLHYGFKVVETLEVGVGVVNKEGVEDVNGEGLKAYLMIYNL